MTHIKQQKFLQSREERGQISSSTALDMIEEIFAAIICVTYGLNTLL